MERLTRPCVASEMTTPRHLFLVALACTTALTATACAAPAPAALLKKIPAPVVSKEAANPVTADVNGDRRDDLLVPYEQKLAVLLSRGDGTFASAPNSPIALPMKVNETIAADFNADGHVDLAFAHHDSYDVAILLGDGAGTFTQPPGSPFNSKPAGKTPHTHGLTAADFNRDSKTDLVVANNTDNDLSLLLGDGTGKFTVAPRSPFPCGRSPYPIATADFDADGNADVIVPNSAPGVNTVTILRGTGDAALVPAPDSPIKIPAGAFFATTGDINGDARPDAVVTHTEGDDRATILINVGDGRLVPSLASPFTIGHNAWHVAIEDINRDGRADLTFAADDAIRIFLSDANGKFSPAPGSPYATPKGAWRMSLADFNADGQRDLVARCVDAKELVLFLGQ